MAFSELQKTIAILRLSLAELQAKEQQLESMISQFRTQLRRLPRQVVYGGTGLDLSLAAMGEIEERLADTLANHQRVLAIKKVAHEELGAHELLQKVDEARRSLQELKQRLRVATGDAGPSEEANEEVRRLENFIAEHSKQAELAITASYKERQAH